MKNVVARDLGIRIRTCREALDLTQQESARRSGVPLTFLRRVERGEVKNLSLERLGLIAVGLDAPLTYLFEPYDRSDDTPLDKQNLIQSISRMLRLHGIAEIRAVKAILREVFAIQRLGRK